MEQQQSPIFGDERPQEEPLGTPLTILSFCLPIVGIILFFVNRGKNKQKSNAACYAALAGMAFGMVVRIATMGMRGYQIAAPAFALICKAERAGDFIKKYPSKIGAELVIPISVVFGSVSILLGAEHIGPGLLLLLLPGGFIVHMFLNTYYVIHLDSLRVRCGFLFDKTIPVMAIREVGYTRNPISAPATSLDRLELRYNRFDSLIISPKDKDAFIAHLKAINTEIIVKPAIKRKRKRHLS